MELTSLAFSESGSIPLKYTCDGDNVSPPLKWAALPGNVKSFALIVDDPDAPRGVFVHWLLYGLRPSENGLAEGIGVEGTAAGGGNQGKNGFGKIAYGGPCPPTGEHRYFFHLYALDDDLSTLRPGASRNELESAMRGHVLEEAVLMGRYRRK